MGLNQGEGWWNDAQQPVLPQSFLKRDYNFQSSRSGLSFGLDLVPGLGLALGLGIGRGLGTVLGSVLGFGLG